MTDREHDILAAAERMSRLWEAYMDDPKHTRPDDYPGLFEAIERVARLARVVSPASDGSKVA